VVRPSSKLKHIHMVGIGGTGMNGIAEVLLNRGYRISGSDMTENQSTRRLTGLGATISVGHKAGLVEGADVVVISSAIKEDNIEVQEARRLKIPVIPRAEMLAELMRLKDGIAVAGSHGKTSTTSMIAQVLETAGKDPTIIVGGRLNTVGAHGKLGEGDYIVAEADESDRSFLYLSPYIAVLTNLDAEHLDQYHTIDEIKKTFVNFANKVPFYCPIVLCLDDANLQSLIPELERKIITYGFSTQADIYASDSVFKNFSSTSLVYHQGQELGTLKLKVPGMHSIYNAMAAPAVRAEERGERHPHHRGLRAPSHRDHRHPGGGQEGMETTRCGRFSTPSLLPHVAPDGRIRHQLQPGGHPGQYRDLSSGGTAGPGHHR